MGQRIMLDVHDVDPNSLRFVRQELSCKDSIVGDFVVVDFICETTAGQRVGFQMFMAENVKHGDLIPVLLNDTMPGLDPEERSDDGTRDEGAESGDGDHQSERADDSTGAREPGADEGA